MDHKLRAVVYMDEDRNADLKRLSLFFDEIQLILPGFFVFKEEVLNDPKRVSTGDDGKKILAGFNFFADTSMDFIKTAESLEGPLKETFLAFEENGIIKELRDYQEDDQFIEFRNILASFDVSDKTFNEITGTNLETYKVEPYSVTVAYDNDRVVEYFFIDPPLSIWDSYRLTTTLYLSHQTSSFPIFLRDRHRKEMEYRYLQYKKGLEILSKHSSNLMPYRILCNGT